MLWLSLSASAAAVEPQQPQQPPPQPQPQPQPQPEPQPQPQPPPQPQPSAPANRTRITVLRSGGLEVGNGVESFVSWGDDITLSSYSPASRPYVVVSFYYRLDDDHQRRPLNVYCWKASCSLCVCVYFVLLFAPLFFCERVVNTWNKLPADTDFSSLSKFKLIITFMDFSDYLHCF